MWHAGTRNFASGLVLSYLFFIETYYAYAIPSTPEVLVRKSLYTCIILVVVLQFFFVYCHRELAFYTLVQLLRDTYTPI